MTRNFLEAKDFAKYFILQNFRNILHFATLSNSYRVKQNN